MDPQAFETRRRHQNENIKLEKVQFIGLYCIIVQFVCIGLSWKGTIRNCRLKMLSIFREKQSFIYFLLLFVLGNKILNCRLNMLDIFREKQCTFLFFVSICLRK